jgi:hypothetical protein
VSLRGRLAGDADPAHTCILLADITTTATCDVRPVRGVLASNVDRDALDQVLASIDTRLAPSTVPPIPTPSPRSSQHANDALRVSGWWFPLTSGPSVGQGTEGMATQEPKKRLIDRPGVRLQGMSIAGIIALGGLFLGATSEPVWGMCCSFSVSCCWLRSGAGSSGTDPASRGSPTSSCAGG